MKAVATAALVIALFLLLAASLDRPDNPGVDYPSLFGPRAGPAHAPPADADPAPEENSEPSDLAHREKVLERFACSDCHGPDAGWLMPDDQDHSSSDRQECQDCHRLVPEPTQIRVHTTMSEGVEPCSLCHSDLAGRSPADNTDDTFEPRPCEACHVEKTEEVLPASHAGRSQSTSTCTVCHETEFLTVPVVPHKIDGWERCEFCHGQQRLTQLAGAHLGDVAQECLRCHDTALSPLYTNERMLTHASEEGGCTACHDVGLMAPLPEGHEDRAGVLCTLCHVPGSAEPNVVPHALIDRGDCIRCHSADGVGALQDSHTDRNKDMCQSCHHELEGGPPEIGHSVENRGKCTDCHAPASSTPVFGPQIAP